MATHSCKKTTRGSFVYIYYQGHKLKSCYVAVDKWTFDDIQNYLDSLAQKEECSKLKQRSDDNQLVKIKLAKKQEWSKYESFERNKYDSIKVDSSKTLLFCLFCLEEYTNSYDAQLCYYRQLRYYPYQCYLCDEVTLEVKDMYDHFCRMHPNSDDLVFKKNSIRSREKWVYKFINYQIKCINGEEAMLPNDKVHKYCPVCNQFDYKSDGQITVNKTRLQYPTELDKNHIHKHLRYNPFECCICLSLGKRFSLSMINKKAKNHLITVHKIINPSVQDLKNNYTNTGTIPELERYINNYVKIINTSRPMVYASKRKRKEATKSSSKKKVSNSNSNSVKGVLDVKKQLNNNKSTLQKLKKVPSLTPTSEHSNQSSDQSSVVERIDSKSNVISQNTNFQKNYVS